MKTGFSRKTAFKRVFLAGPISLGLLFLSSILLAFGSTGAWAQDTDASVSPPPQTAALPRSIPVPLLGTPSFQQAFGSGERLEYELSWGGIKAGTAVLEVPERLWVGDRAVYKLVSTARSNRFVSLFHKVDDRIESLMDAEGMYSHRITVRQREGNRKRDKEMWFDQENHTVRVIKEGRNEQFSIPPRVQDALTVLYYFRSVPNVPIGGSVFVDVHEDGKNWQLEIRVEGRERLETPVGTYDTIKTKAAVRYEGIFLDRGDMNIWFTDDARRVPLLMRSKIKIGHISAVLVKMQVPDLLAGATPAPATVP